MTRGRSERLRSVATVGAWASPVIAIAVVSTTWAYVWSRSARELFAPLGFVSLDHAAEWQILAGRILASLSCAVGAAALLALGGCFRSIAGSSSFEMGTARSLVRFAGLTFLTVVISIVTPPATSILLSAGADPARGRLVLMANSNHLFALLAVFAFWVLARLLREAVLIARENEEFV